MKKASCHHGAFKAGKGYVEKFTASNHAEEIRKNSATSGRVPIGKRGGRATGKR